MLTAPTPHWALLALEAVGQGLDDFTRRPCLTRPIPNSLSRWFDISSTRLTSLLTSNAPGRGPCPRSKPWWSPPLSALRREYHKCARMSRLDPSPLNCSNVKSSRRVYFKAIASAKKAHWSDFLSSATPHSLWTAKRFMFGRPPQRFPNIPGATDPSEVAETLLHHFFPPKCQPPPLLRLRRHHDYTPLTSKEISRALAKCSNTSARRGRPHSVLGLAVRTPPQALPTLLGPRPPAGPGFPPPLPQESTWHCPRQAG